MLLLISPDQDPGVICRYIQESLAGRSLPIHTVAYDCIMPVNNVSEPLSGLHTSTRESLNSGHFSFLHVDAFGRTCQHNRREIPLLQFFVRRKYFCFPFLSLHGYIPNSNKRLNVLLF